MALQGLKLLSDFPPHELQRLLVDGVILRDEKGWQHYEDREPGCTQAFFKALKYVQFLLQTRPTTQLSSTLFQTIHAIIFIQSNSFGAAPGLFFTSPKFYIKLDKTVPTVAGIEQWLCALEQNSPWAPSSLCIDKVSINRNTIGETANKLEVPRDKLAQKLHDLIQECESGNIQLWTRRMDPLSAFELIQSACDTFNQNMANTTDRDQKLHYIVKIVQQLEQLHPFTDFNNRVFINLLLRFLLIQNGFSFPILDNYNIFDLQSVDEIVLAIKEGMEIAEKITRGEIQQAHGFDSTLLLASQSSLTPKTSVFTAPLDAQLKSYFLTMEEKFCLQNLFANFVVMLGMKIPSLNQPNRDLQAKIASILQPIGNFFATQGQATSTKPISHEKYNEINSIFINAKEISRGLFVENQSLLSELLALFDDCIDKLEEMKRVYTIPMTTSTLSGNANAFFEHSAVPSESLEAFEAQLR
jgi:hypothetical protein